MNDCSANHGRARHAACCSTHPTEQPTQARASCHLRAQPTQLLVQVLLLKPRLLQHTIAPSTTREPPKAGFKPRSLLIRKQYTHTSRCEPAQVGYYLHPRISPNKQPVRWLAAQPASLCAPAVNEFTAGVMCACSTHCMLTAALAKNPRDGPKSLVHGMQSHCNAQHDGARRTKG